MKSVQETNDSSVASKCSAAKLGYFDDKFITHFVNNASGIRRSPLINRGYYVRAKAVLWAFDRFFSSLTVDSPFQVVSLGAGYDTAFFRMLNEDSHFGNCCTAYCEFDFLEVARNKAAVILNTPSLKCLLAELQCQKSMNGRAELVICSKIYKLVGVNLEDITSLENALMCIGINFNLPTFILSECAIVYMEPNSCDRLVSYIAGKFSDAILAVYEQVFPTDAFGKIMLRHFENQNSPLKCISKYTDPISLTTRYTTLGWDSCICIGMSEFYSNFLKTEEKTRVDTLEAFDEYEEFHLKCNHYVISVACKGTRISAYKPNLQFTQLGPNHLYKNLIVLLPVMQVKHSFRYTHCSELVHKNFVISFGGFGNLDGKHQRLTTVHLLDTNSFQERVLSLEDEVFAGGIMHHSSVCLKDGKVIIFGGRTSPLKPSCELTRLEIQQEQVEQCPLANVKLLLKKVVSAGDLPSPRWRHSTCLVKTNGIEYMVLYGGTSVGGNVLGDCFMLNIPEMKWCKVFPKGDGPVPCHSHAITTWDEKIILSGGLAADQTPLSAIYVLDCHLMQWTVLKIPNVLPRYSHTCHVWKGWLFLVGGVNLSANCPPGIGVLNLETLTLWEIPLPCRDELVMLHNHTSIVIGDELFIIGGGGNCFSFGTHFNNYVYKICLRSVVESLNQ